MQEKVSITDISEIKLEGLPSIISSQFTKLSELDKKVKDAVDRANDAKNIVKNAQVKIGLFDYSKKDAIEFLQSASEGIAEGLIVAVEAQKKSFDYQTELAGSIKFLFGLGISNIAMNRSIVRELELKLKNASEEEISELARQEIKNVILQLKAQEDTMKIQNDLKMKVKNHQDWLKGIDRQLDNFERDTCNSIKIIEKSLVLQGQALIDNNNNLDEKFSVRTNELKNELSNLISRINEDITLLVCGTNAQIVEIKSDLSKSETSLFDKIYSLEENFNNLIDELDEEIKIKDKEAENKLLDFKNRINNLDIITSKLGWKILISVVATVSLILNFFQIYGVL